MSTRQKSFFEQDHSNRKKIRPHWNRTRSTGNAASNTTATSGTMAKPPIAPSSQTKSKLKAFQFAEGVPAPAQAAENSDKENQPIETPKKISTEEQEGQVEMRKSQHDTGSPGKPKKVAPSTPATRLPLADLIGHMEDASRRQPAPEPSPEERVIWEHAITPGNADAKPVRRSKKRARSSSPVSSSQNEASNSFGGEKEPFDVQNLQQSLKTPNANPATEVWNRYTQGLSSKFTPTTNKAVAFAHLIDSSSPASAGSVGSVSGLRRWASCGIEWPTSKAKRRKTNASAMKDHVEHAFAAADAEQEDAVQPKQSRVGFLVERIQESLAKPPPNECAGGISSSSPLPETGAFLGAPAVSPLQRLAPVQEETEVAQHVSPEIRAADTSETLARNEADDRQSSSSEFGGGDLDMDMLDVVAHDGNANKDHPPLAQEPVFGQATTDYNGQDTFVAADTYSVRPAGNEDNDDTAHGDEFEGDDDIFETDLPTVGETSLAQLNANTGYGDADDEDEFGDDIFAGDLEQVASLYDNRPDVTQLAPEAANDPAPQHTHKSQVPNAGNAENAGEVDVIDVAGSSDDEFGDDDLDMEQFEKAEAAATQAYQASGRLQGSSDHERRVIQRYQIKSIVESTYLDEKDRVRPEKVLVVEDEKSKISKAITLRQAWVDTPCTTGSYVHVIGQFGKDGQCFIDNSSNLLILHPDHLLSATAVSDSFGCLRRAVLQDRIKATGDASKPQLYGNILHQLFQEALKANRWDTESLGRLIEAMLPKYFETLAELNLEVREALDHLRGKMPQLQAWAEIFVRPVPANDGFIKDRSAKKVTMAINKLLDVEEKVWSPMYGLKGNIDASVQVVLQDEAGERTLTVPFELKTGRNTSEAHRAQTALYTLLMSDRYDVDVVYGILYYMESSDTTRIEGVRHELMHMIMQRNELACYVRERLQLPPMLKNSHLCGRCYARTSCFLYNKLAEDGDGGDVGPKEQFQKLARYLQPADQEFFKKWDFLLTKEETEMMRFRRELWTMLSKDRERLGRCFANVVMEPGSASEQAEGGKINRFNYTFVKEKPKAGFSFAEAQITVGEPIVISDEKGHFALANGYVTNIRKRRITVAVDRRLHNARIKEPDFDNEVNQTFAGIMNVSNVAIRKPDTVEAPVLYRLDKDEFSNGMATVRNNLLQIMDDEIFKARDLRSLIIHRRPPAFKTSAAAYSVRNTSTPMEMNGDQIAAIEKVMSAEDYALVLGMPGTGKTTTIAHIIRALVAKGKSVLLTSYTHTAVDNILLKIRHDGFGILRLGAAAKVHPDVQEFAILAARPKETLEEVTESWMGPPIVATTCLGINHPLFNQRTFDYCIVDEASQITLPVCLGPIRMARQFILVGDHYQLPPLVQNKEALEGGLDVSLFKLLSEQYPDAVVNLEHQYRMCADVMLLSNQLIYDGRLKCGNEAIATRSVDIPNLAGLEQHHYSTFKRPSHTQQPSSACASHRTTKCWLARALSPTNKVHFVSTDTLRPTSLETLQGGTRILNALEATLTTQLVESLLSTGITASSIGIITFYRSQLALLRQHLRHRPGLEMHTADKFQGRDKEVIILSLVRSNDTGNVGELLKDWRRVNVAVTRARSKLVMVGSKRTIERGGQVLKGLVEICERKGWLHDLQKDAVESHWFEEFGTQISEATPAKVGRGSPVKSEQGSPSLKRSQKASPVQTGSQKRVLGESSGNGGLRSSSGKASPEKKVFGLKSGGGLLGKKVPKVPAKKGEIRAEALLNGRLVSQDIVNSIL